MHPDPLHEINILATKMLATFAGQHDRRIVPDGGSAFVQNEARARRIAELSDSGKGEG